MSEREEIGFGREEHSKDACDRIPVLRFAWSAAERTGKDHYVARRGVEWVCLNIQPAPHESHYRVDRHGYVDAHGGDAKGFAADYRYEPVWMFAGKRADPPR